MAGSSPASDVPENDEDQALLVGVERAVEPALGERLDDVRPSSRLSTRPLGPRTVATSRSSTRRTRMNARQFSGAGASYGESFSRGCS